MRAGGTLVRIVSIAALVTALMVWRHTTAQEPVTPTGTGAAAGIGPTRADYLALAEEVEGALRRDVLDAWFPRCVDTANGGGRS